jgi:hypothetical protein
VGPGRCLVIHDALGLTFVILLHETRWMGTLIGHNAIYVPETLRHRPIPARLEQEFQSVTDLGLHEIHQRRRPLHTLEIAICRELR